MPAESGGADRIAVTVTPLVPVLGSPRARVQFAPLFESVGRMALHMGNSPVIQAVEAPHRCRWR